MTTKVHVDWLALRDNLEPWVKVILPALEESVVIRAVANDLVSCIRSGREFKGTTYGDARFMQDQNVRDNFTQLIEGARAAILAAKAG